jgi:hypothetical protein
MVRGGAVRAEIIGKKLVAGAALPVVVLVGAIIRGAVWLHERRLARRSRFW